MRLKTETFDIWHYLCAGIYNPLIRCRMDFDGRIDADALKRAVTLSRETIPLIGCRFDGKSRRPRWIWENYTGGDMTGAVEARGDAETQIHRNSAPDIDVERGPQLRIVTVSGPEGDTLCVTINHMVSDGAGLLQYLSLLGRIYTALKNGEAPPVQHSRPRGTSLLYKKIRFPEKNRIYYSDFVAYESSRLGNYGVGTDAADILEPHLVALALSRDELAMLKNYAAARNATVNDGLIALYARMLCRYEKIDNIMFPATIDLRKFIPAGVKYGIGNYSGSFSCGVRVDAGDSLAATIERVAAQTRVLKSGNDVLKQIIRWDLTVFFTGYKKLRRNFSSSAALPMITFSNLGVIDSDRFCYHGMPASGLYVSGTVRPRPYMQLTTSTFNGVCTLCCNMLCTRDDRLLIEKMLGSLRDDLISAVKG